MKSLTSKKTYSIVILIVLLLLSVTFYSYQDFYKQYIIRKIYSSIDFKFIFKESSLTFFPSPGLVLSKVRIEKKDSDIQIESESETMEFLFSWKILLGEIELNSIQSKNSKIELSSLKKHNQVTTNPKTLDIQSLQKIFSFLNLDTIHFQSLQVMYLDENLLREDFFFHSLTVNSDHLQLITLDFLLNYQLGEFRSNTKIKYFKNNFTMNSIEIESKLKFKNFNLKPFKEYYSLIYGANFDNTFLNGEVTLFKENFKNEFYIKTDLEINKLHFSGFPVYPTIYASSEFKYIAESRQINFQNIRLNYEKGAVASASGNLKLANDITLNLNIQGEYADIYEVIYLIVRFVDFKSASKINFKSHMKIICARAIYDVFDLRRINLELDIYNSLIDINVYTADAIQGNISGKGRVIASSNSSYDFDVTLNGINSEELIHKYTKNSYIKGQLSSNLHFQSSGNSLPLFLDNLKSNGNIDVKSGELLGYANILKPLFSLGKFVNILGPRGKNTEFKTLSLEFKIENKNIKVKNLKMIGVGVDAHGGGTVNFDRKIDFRIYAGLGGLAGKALYIPILYKGVIPDNVSYIDPLWIGTVYVGATIFGGPAGATVGGFAGSAVSEYVNKALEGLKGLFSRESKEE